MSVCGSGLRLSLGRVVGLGRDGRAVDRVYESSTVMQGDGWGRGTVLAAKAERVVGGRWKVGVHHASAVPPDAQSGAAAPGRVH